MGTKTYQTAENGCLSHKYYIKGITHSNFQSVYRKADITKRIVPDKFIREMCKHESGFYILRSWL